MPSERCWRVNHTKKKKKILFLNKLDSTVPKSSATHCWAAHLCGTPATSSGETALNVPIYVPLVCSRCPAGTEPAVGFEYKWWNTLPSNMETTVLSGINFEYKGMTGMAPPGTPLFHFHPIPTGWEIPISQNSLDLCLEGGYTNMDQAFP